MRRCVFPRLLVRKHCYSRPPYPVFSRHTAIQWLQAQEAKADGRASIPIQTALVFTPTHPRSPTLRLSLAQSALACHNRNTPSASFLFAGRSVSPSWEFYACFSVSGPIPDFVAHDCPFSYPKAHRIPRRFASFNTLHTCACTVVGLFLTVITLAHTQAHNTRPHQ